MKFIPVFLAAAFLLSSCFGMPFSPSTPTLTSSPSMTATSELTETPFPTYILIKSATPDLITIYRSLVPGLPLGFDWKILPEQKLAVVIPDNWYFKEETDTKLGADAFYITKEDIDATDRFSTGLTVLVFKDFQSYEEAKQFAKDLIKKQKNLDTTKEILEIPDPISGPYIVDQLRIKAEYPNETPANKNKIVHYAAMAINDSVYLSAFEAPESLWDQTFNEYRIVLDQMAIFGG